MALLCFVLELSPVKEVILLPDEYRKMERYIAQELESELRVHQLRGSGCGLSLNQGLRAHVLLNLDVRGLFLGGVGLLDPPGWDFQSNTLGDQLGCLRSSQTGGLSTGDRQIRVCWRTHTCTALTEKLFILRNWLMGRGRKNLKSER